jgi:hypothetical protein
LSERRHTVLYTIPHVTQTVTRAFACTATLMISGGTLRGHASTTRHGGATHGAWGVHGPGSCAARRPYCSLPYPLPNTEGHPAGGRRGTGAPWACMVPACMHGAWARVHTACMRACVLRACCVRACVRACVCVLCVRVCVVRVCACVAVRPRVTDYTPLLHSSEGTTILPHSPI